LSQLGFYKTAESIKTLSHICRLDIEVERNMSRNPEQVITSELERVARLIGHPLGLIAVL
jgi:hypothetical protein